MHLFWVGMASLRLVKGACPKLSVWRAHAVYEVVAALRSIRLPNDHRTHTPAFTLMASYSGFLATTYPWGNKKAGGSYTE